MAQVNANANWEDMAWLAKLSEEEFKTLLERIETLQKLQLKLLKQMQKDFG